MENAPSFTSANQRQGSGAPPVPTSPQARQQQAVPQSPLQFLFAGASPQQQRAQATQQERIVNVRLFAVQNDHDDLKRWVEDTGKKIAHHKNTMDESYTKCKDIIAEINATQSAPASSDLIKSLCDDFARHQRTIAHEKEQLERERAEFKKRKAELDEKEQELFEANKRSHERVALREILLIKQQEPGANNNSNDAGSIRQRGGEY